MHTLDALEKEQSGPIPKSLEQEFAGQIFWDGSVLHLSRALEEHENLGVLLFWAWKHACNLVWHDRTTFAVQFRKEAQTVKVGENELQRYVVQLLDAAYQRKASDIHILVTGTYTQIRLRILGSLYEYEQKSALFGDHLVALLYNYFAQQTGAAVFSRLQRLDGRILNEQILPAGLYAVRLHAEPIQAEARESGTLMCLRLLYDATDAKGTLHERLVRLGFLESQCSDIAAMTERGGLALVSGATGQGKSTVLKHILEAMVALHPERAYLSVEDPPEYRIQGVAQIQVKTQTSEDAQENRAWLYREAIAGALRSDPDVMMIGEIRYAEAAEAAVAAALTGHGVWATLHAADTFSCITRLEHLLHEAGIENPLEMFCDGTVLQGLCYQRLYPVLCPNCKQSVADLAPSKVEQLIGKDRVAWLMQEVDCDVKNLAVRGSGCTLCKGQGNLAMTVCAETVLLNYELLELCKAHALFEARSLWRRQGGIGCREVVLQKMAEGLIDVRS